MFCYHYPPAASLHPSIASRLQSLELPGAFVGAPSLTCKSLPLSYTYALIRSDIKSTN